MRQHEPPGDGSPLWDLSYPLMPADPGRHGEVVEAPPDWSFEPAVFDPEADAVVWGRTPDRSSPRRSAMQHAAAREATLRTMQRRIPAHLRLVAIHRLPPRQLESRGLRSGIRAAIRGGALVELSSVPEGARVIDRVLGTVEAKLSDTAFHAGTGGAMLIRVVLPDGSAALLRLAREGAPGDPAPSADILEHLARASVPLTPRVHARGHVVGASWLLERALRGRRPRRASGALARQVAEICAAFPRGEGPPTATAADLAGIAARLPDRAGAIAELAAELSGHVQGLPSVLRHGDLWAGNLLVDRGRLSGLVDWDAAHPTAVPGSDLLQLVATELRRGARRALGPAFLSRPWRSLMFSQIARGYWDTLGIRPSEAVLDCVGIAWWASEVHGTLARLPHRASDERWVATNVDPVLSELGY